MCTDADGVVGRGGGEHVGQIGHQPGVGIGGEVIRRQVESLSKGDQHRHRDGPLVVFQLVHVAGGQIQRPGQRRLAQAALVSQPPQTGTRKHLRHALRLYSAMAYTTFANCGESGRKITHVQVLSLAADFA
jgi:hypothetical protein